MKTLSAVLSDHLSGGLLTLACLVVTTRRDGAVFGFTDFDRSLFVQGVLFEANSVMVRSAIQTTATMSVNNLSLTGALESERISEDDLRAGLWDGAGYQVYLVNWNRPEAGAVLLMRGVMGQVTIGAPGFSVEVRGLTQYAAQRLVTLFSPCCRAQLGDARCEVDLSVEDRTQALTVTAVSDTEPLSSFTVAGPSPGDGFWDNGRLTWTSGSNQGRSVEIYQNSGPVLTLMLRAAYPIAVGDTLTAVVGCDKTPKMCRLRFTNIRRFRGEPFAPGSDQVLLYPNTHQ